MTASDDSQAPLPDTLPPNYPVDLRRVWQTADGTRVSIRALHPGDLDREIAFVSGLSDQTLYQRLQYARRNVSREEMARLLDLDYRDQCAVGAFIPAESEETLIGVSRYARSPAAGNADCAIVVADDWHGRGVGTELMRSLTRAAKAQGLRALVGSSLAENQRIHDWGRRFGCEVRTEPNSGGIVNVILDLDSLHA